MLKLIKYEFRKQLTTMIVMLTIIGIAELAFIGFCLADKTTYAALLAILLFIIDMVCFFMVFILGIMSYSKEISGRSGFMAFMTPNSATSIILSKLLYAAILASIVGVASVVFGAIDLKLLLHTEGEEINYFEMFKMIFSLFGLSIDQILIGTAAYVVTALAGFLSNVTVAYLSITLSATLLSNSKARGLISVIFYFGISGIISAISLILPRPDFLEDALSFGSMMLIMIPSFIVDALVIVACVIFSSYLLKNKVSL